MNWIAGSLVQPALQKGCSTGTFFAALLEGGMFRNWLNLTKSTERLLMNKQIRLFIIDSNTAWREAIDAFLNNQPDMAVIGSCSHLYEAVKKDTFNPDVVLIDKLPTTESERALFEQLKHKGRQGCYFVLHGGSHQEDHAVELREMGVIASVPKGSSPRKIAQVVREACQGDLDV
jgi:DNA-binding NarL/FixJ family response regulator